jgi:hypothetical protein
LSNEVFVALTHIGEQSADSFPCDRLHLAGHHTPFRRGFAQSLMEQPIEAGITTARHTGVTEI